MNRGERIKRQIITLERIVKTGCINFVRNAWLSIAAVAVMVITLTIVLFSVIANNTFTYTLQQITDKIDISVYLKDEISEQQRNDLINSVQALENVESVTYVSKEDALNLYKQQNADNPELLSAISQTDNPLPASLQVKPQDPDRIDELRLFFESEEIKALQSEPTSYSGERKDAIDKITKSASFFRRAGYVGIIVFAITSMMIIFNTIQMAIFNRRDEITIMRLLGASTTYIRGPFVVEAILYGLISGFISVMLLNGFFTASSSSLGTVSLGLLDTNYAYQYFSQNFWRFLTLQLGVGIFIGAASSLIATRRYLKFKTTK